MHVSEIATGKPPQLRRVGITFPTRKPVMDTAVRIYRELNLDPEIEHHTIYFQCPRILASFYMGLIERYTGHPAWNEWEQP